MEIFIIPLIALAVWVLQYLFRGPEETPKTTNSSARPRPASTPKPQPTNRPQPKRQVTDLDRYLEETRRRRQQDDKKPVVVVAEVAPAPRRPAPPPPPPPQTRAPSNTPRTERRPSTQRPMAAPVETARPAPLTVQPIKPLEAPPAAVIRPTTVVSRVESRPGIEQIPISEDAPRRPTPAMITELHRMLRAPQGLAMAFILREIFDPPLSTRQQR